MAQSPLAQDIIEAVDRSLPHVKAEDAVEAVLCVLAQRLSGGEARDMVQELPEELRSAIRTCVAHRDTPAEAWDLGEFRDRVARHLQIAPEQAQLLMRVVLPVIRAHLSDKESHDIYSQLPRGLREMWTESEV